ncbi:hypothetical protein V1525DRAFT_405440 [Lipomyces kononenkoae]|uniref:Uncharacterized protein n=1 Tax=Lipomyces kononenkoae TaxID=34357 RepID=A0ACC3SZC5_LIPKO
MQALSLSWCVFTVLCEVPLTFRRKTRVRSCLAIEKIKRVRVRNPYRTLTYYSIIAIHHLLYIQIIF